MALHPFVIPPVPTQACGSGSVAGKKATKSKQKNKTCREKIRRGRLEAADSFHLSLTDEDRMGQAELRIAAQ